MRPNIFDRLKVSSIIFVRYVNYRAIEQWSKKTFHKTLKGPKEMPKLVPAHQHYNSPGIPKELFVPEKMPRGSRLPFLYNLPYYFLTVLLFRLYRLIPIRRGIPWRPEMKANKAFPKNEEGWQDINGDEEFTQLRLQGPNPFLLRKSEQGTDTFLVDYSPYFKNIFAPVVCHFQLVNGQLKPTAIDVDGQVHLPGSEGWKKAKLFANALDVRYCVLTRHLLDTHLVIGQAFALATFALGKQHPLRSFFQLFTYGTIAVNNFAFQLLITPASYFIQSNFVTEEDTLQLFRNSMEVFTFDELVVPMDIAQRGIDKIPNHPYVEDALEIWGVFQKFVGQYIDEIYQKDIEIQQDTKLQDWYKVLASLLPNRDITDDPLLVKQDLIDVICCMFYNNVNHEVCGDFSPFGQSANPDHKKLINFQRLKEGIDEEVPEFADVFLFDQAAFTGRFNNGGNNLLELPVNKLTKDESLRQFVHRFQSRLKELDQQLEQRNQSRQIPFLRLLPRKWEASISF